MSNHYSTLNLSDTATINEIKASFRRLAKQFHPDSCSGNGDPSRFYKIHEAYRALMSAKSVQWEKPPCPDPEIFQTRTAPKVEVKPEPQAQSKPGPTGPGALWRFEGVAEKGADVIYVIKVSAAAAESGLDLILPWKAEEACPSCLGQGRSLQPLFGGRYLHNCECLKCQATGVIKHNSTAHVELTQEIIIGGRLRLPGLGHYRPKQAVRGDLIIEVSVIQTDSRRSGLYSA